jgi:hypothetical protein
MAKEDETPRTNPAEIESLIEQIRGTNLDPRAKDKVERPLRNVLTLVVSLQRKKCPFGRTASALEKTVPTPFCRKDTSY